MRIWRTKSWKDELLVVSKKTFQQFRAIPGTVYGFSVDTGEAIRIIKSMGRIARVVIPGIPHHVTQRGNRRMEVFFGEEDYHAYLGLILEWCKVKGVELWAYCLMPNHMHLIAVPEKEDSLARAIGEAHRRYTRRVNFREGWRGHLWQGRFGSCPMDPAHTLRAARYVELNPVRARLVQKPWHYQWSSCKAHVEGRCDQGFIRVEPLLSRVEDRAEFIEQPLEAEEKKRLRLHFRTGRPLGSDRFVKQLERQTGRRLRPGRPGRPRKSESKG